MTLEVTYNLTIPDGAIFTGKKLNKVINAALFTAYPGQSVRMAMKRIKVVRRATQP